MKILLVGFLMLGVLDAAIDVDFADKNLTQTQKLGSQFKRERDAALLRAPAAHHAGLVGTDTDLLVKGITDGNNNDYVAFAKAGIKADLGAWLNAVCPGAGNKFVAAMARRNNAGAADTPADRTRASFVTALDAVIDAVPLAGMPGASASARLSTLRATKLAVNVEIARVVNAWIDTLLAANNNFLENNPAATPGAPANRSRNAFKAALEARIRTF